MMTDDRADHAPPDYGDARGFDLILAYRARHNPSTKASMSVHAK
jgi:hypothetical protein